jgi:hypothetical protein
MGVLLEGGGARERGMNAMLLPMSHFFMSRAVLEAQRAANEF